MNEAFERLTIKHVKFLKRMNWWKKKTNLESLMLVVCEVAESAEELRPKNINNEKFSDELADMFAAAPYIESQFDGVSQLEAQELLKEWMLTFDERHSK